MGETRFFNYNLLYSLVSTKNLTIASEANLLSYNKARMKPIGLLYIAIQVNANLPYTILVHRQLPEMQITIFISHQLVRTKQATSAHSPLTKGCTV
jgi:hypothetical protein